MSAAAPAAAAATRSSDRARALALAAARVAADTRGADVKILDLRALTQMFDYFVLATGTSRRQIHAMADEIDKVVEAELHDHPRGAEGYEEGRWIVIDYGDVVVHLFDAESRDYWDLEHLWSGAATLAMPAAGADGDG